MRLWTEGNVAVNWAGGSELGGKRCGIMDIVCFGDSKMTDRYRDVS